MQNHHPKLRPIHPQPAVARGQPILLLQDPLQLAETAVFIPQSLAPLLAFCDGTRNLDELRASLMIRAGIRISAADLEFVISRLDEALLLENARSSAALEKALEAYRAAPSRPPSMAGNGYPAEPDALCALLDGYLNALPPDSEPKGRLFRGLVSPHIDFQRGGAVYAQVWDRAAEAARRAELVVILGTDHHGSDGRITLTRQHYATPYGVLPTDVAVVDAVADAIGEEAAFDEELHHRSEHSIELAAVWLHHMREGQSCPVVPILTGSFFHHVRQGSSPAGDPTIDRVVQALQDSLSARSALVVAAGDLAHVGPAFDGPPVDMMAKAALKVQDEKLVATICSGDAEVFFQTIQAEGDRRNICGLPPIYLMLRLLEDGRGELAGYDRCPADTANTSFVSICGVVIE